MGQRLTADTEQPDGLGDDASLVQAAQAGDPGAFATLFARHRDGVFRACLRRLRDAHDADEVVQAAFVRAFERIDQCQGERRFGAWVHVIAQRLCIDLQRSRSRLAVVDVPVSDGPSDQPGPEERALDRELARQVRAAIAQLPRRQGRAVAAADLDGRPSAEIAAAMGVSVGAVDSLLHRARRNLAVSLRDAASNGALGSVHVGPAVVASEALALATRATRAFERVGRAGSRAGERLWVALQPMLQPFGGQGVGRAAAGVAAALAAVAGLALGSSRTLPSATAPPWGGAGARGGPAAGLGASVPTGLLPSVGLASSPVGPGGDLGPSSLGVPGLPRPSVGAPSPTVPEGAAPDPSGEAQTTAARTRSQVWAGVQAAVGRAEAAAASVVGAAGSAVGAAVGTVGRTVTTTVGELAAGTGQVASGLASGAAGAVGGAAGAVGGAAGAVGGAVGEMAGAVGSLSGSAWAGSGGVGRAPPPGGEDPTIGGSAGAGVGGSVPGGGTTGGGTTGGTTAGTTGGTASALAASGLLSG